ncbi:MAG TPA: hypothetical protein VMV39_02325 [Terracidiphilus sp.]|jgi:hypothetical protein|nr:hypothetical protein [Terracidiphilus sp.]
MNALKTSRLHSLALAIVGAFLSVLPAGATSFAQDIAATPNPSSGCSANEPTSYPKVAISNGAVSAVLYPPDAKRGYYRGARFDWSGVVGCLSYKGHTYFGVWFSDYDPMKHDAITGPVEEFRSGDGDSALKYDEAKPGEPFVKIGVGVLRRIDDAPFKFSLPYPLIDGGRWTVHSRPNSVLFEQDLKSPIGIAYVYKKTVSLDKSRPILILHHELKNTGTETIDTQVYDHDFFMLDSAPTGPDMVVRFPFDPKADKDLGSGARIDGRQIIYNRELKTGETASGLITGYSGDASSYDFVVENRRTGVGVEQTGDQPISRINFWSIRTTICPEAYLHFKIAPGETARWTIRYRFYAK